MVNFNPVVSLFFLLWRQFTLNGKGEEGRNPVFANDICSESRLVHCSCKNPLGLFLLVDLRIGKNKLDKSKNIILKKGRRNGLFFVCFPYNCHTINFLAVT